MNPAQVVCKQADGETLFYITLAGIFVPDLRDGHPNFTPKGGSLRRLLAERLPGAVITKSATVMDHTILLRRGTCDAAVWSRLTVARLQQLVDSHRPRFIKIAAAPYIGSYQLRTSWPLAEAEVQKLTVSFDIAVAVLSEPGFALGTLHQLVRTLGSCTLSAAAIAMCLGAEVAIEAIEPL